MAEIYATLDDVKTALDKQTTADDAALLLILKAASRSIDNFCNRPDGFVADEDASARLYAGSGGPVLLIDECVAISTVAVKDSPTEDAYTDWNPGDWLAFTGDPRFPDFNPLVKGKPYTAIMATATGEESRFAAGRYAHLAGFRPSSMEYRGVPTVQVTARWGHSEAVPDEIREACIIQSARWFRRGLSQWADTVGNMSTGRLFYRKPLDPAVEMILVKGHLKRAAL